MVLLLDEMGKILAIKVNVVRTKDDIWKIKFNYLDMAVVALEVELDIDALEDNVEQEDSVLVEQ